ncbi:glycosyltransferase family 8 protein [Patellaria atrata CBS 101060]|uniref:Glycosyltransferase family 8 protein n=1 Tax=Patellaria atrata CBS 101060 TaxID=1346257 RepID=A0A9P4VV09_9PEZI|nr:glycosyltransferase family 8 protein [Patellaria atrata CBS 101060]
MKNHISYSDEREGPPRDLADEMETSTNYLSQWGSWLSTRRVRNLIAITVFCLLAFSLLRWSPTQIQNYRTQDAGLQRPAITLPPGNIIDWSQYAYIQYVTNLNYLCNSMMIFEALDRLDSKASRVMMYPRTWELPDNNGTSSLTEEIRLLLQARDTYKVNLVPVEVQTFHHQEATWKDSFTKLLAFNQTQYKRVLSLDSDSTVLQHMDELFLLPSAPVAMPRGYWLEEKTLSSQLVLVEPSEFEWNRVEAAIADHGDKEFDMDIINNLYAQSCMIIPHRPYNLLTGEFRSDLHTDYLGSSEEVWDPKKVQEEVKFVHFSDWPYPKPWIQPLVSQTEEMKPKCQESSDSSRQDCTARDIWLHLYEDFSDRRLRVCGRRYDSSGVKRARSFTKLPTT